MEKLLSEKETEFACHMQEVSDTHDKHQSDVNNGHEMHLRELNDASTKQMEAL